MRVGFITHWYDPEGGAAAGPGTLARALRDRGHDVHVVTGYPTYPVGKVFDGYRVRPYQREDLEGVTVHRSPIYPSHDTRASRRMLNYGSFAVSGSVIALSTLRSMDCAFVYSTPATVGLPGLALESLAGVPYIMQVQDLWPDTVLDSGFVNAGSGRRMKKPLNVFCNAVYRRACTVAVTSPGMRDILTERGVPAAKIEFLPNWAEERSFRPTPPSEALKRRLGLTRDFLAMYAGNLGEVQNLETVIDAAALLRDRHNIGFVLVGAGVAESRLRSRVAQLGLENVTFVPPQPFSRMADVLALGDVQLVALKDVPLYRATLPSKLQANLASARPIVAAVAGDGGRLVEQAGAGFATPPSAPEPMAEAILRMAQMSPAARRALGESGRTHYLEHYSEQVIGDRLSHLVEAASQRKSAR